MRVTRPRGWRGVPVVLAGTAVAVTALTAAGCGGTDDAAAPTTGTTPAATVPGPGPDPPAPTISVPDPEPLPAAAAEAASWAPVVRGTTARARPGLGGRVVARVSARTPEGTENIVLVEGRGADRRGRTWVRVRLSGRVETVGWVPRTALGGYAVVETAARVDLDALTLTVTRGGRTVFRAPVGVGTPDAPTPTGRFYVRNKLTRYSSPTYGPLAFGTSAQSPTLTDWPAGGFVGIHGTDQPEILPGRVSHGCIRLRNADIERLAGVLPIGTPLTIV